MMRIFPFSGLSGRILAGILLFACLSVLLPASLQAQQDTLVLVDASNLLNTNISSYCQFYIDSTGKKTIGQVSQQLFLDQKLTHSGNWENRKATTFWIRLTIQNTGNAEYDLFLFIGYHDYLYFYTQDTGKSFLLLQKAGLMLSRGGRSRWDSFAFSMPVPASSIKTFYLKVTDKFYVENPVEPMLYNKSGLEEYKLHEIWLYQPDSTLIIVLMGMLSVLFCFMAISFRQSPDKSYLYYGLLVLGLVFFYGLRLETMPYQISFFNYFPLLKYDWNTTALIFCLYFMYALFARAFLNLKQLFPLLDKGFGYAAWVYGGVVIAELILLINQQYYASNILYITVYFVSIIPLIVVFFILFRKKENPLVRYFLIGSICLFLAQLLTHFITILNEAGLSHLPPGISPQYSLLVGIVTELLFFAIGLNYRNNLVHIRNSHAQERLISELSKNKELQKQLNEELELQVREQTSEILNKNKELEIQRQLQLEMEYNKRLTELELRAIRAQINPHFIFNCMNSIQLFVMQRDFESAQKYLTDFSLLIRKTLDMSKLNFVSLTDEINYLNTYLSLEKMRFENRLEYEIIIDPGIIPNEAEIPSMLLQPYVENAVKHGIHVQPGSTGKLQLTFRQKDNDLICTMEDNGIGIHKSKELKPENSGPSHFSAGMDLSSNRAELLNKMFNTSIRIEILDKEDLPGNQSGTIVKITIPQL
ncbi:MAG TPA: histidine kinase [Chitinophagaceae bacterium]|nr:histidine kinase [Chitinophagaceae bacterium]